MSDSTQLPRTSLHPHPPQLVHSTPQTQMPTPQRPQQTAQFGTQTPMNEDLVAAEALTRLTATPPPITPPAMSISTPMSNLSIDELQSHSQSQSITQPYHVTTPSGVQHPLIAKVNQVSRHPIVRDAFKYYENSKRNYPHFNFAAGIVERAAMPVVNKIEVNLNNRHRERMAVKKKKRRTRPDKNETKKRLQFCLHLLKLANEQINTQVNFFHNKITEREMKIRRERERGQEVQEQEQGQEVQQQGQGEVQRSQGQGQVHDQAQVQQTELAEAGAVSMDFDDAITQIPSTEDTKVAQETKSEIISTVKKIVHVISNFKTSTLNSDSSAESSNELRSTIRDIILKLPSQVQQTAIHNTTSGPQANEKIFVFAKESLDMIGRLTSVFNEQLEKAENWIGEMDPASAAVSTTVSVAGSRSQTPVQFSQTSNSTSAPAPAPAPASNFNEPPPPYNIHDGVQVSDNKIQT